jgi:hypothetical protein
MMRFISFALYLFLIGGKEVQASFLGQACLHHLPEHRKRQDHAHIGAAGAAHEVVAFLFRDFPAVGADFDSVFQLSTFRAFACHDIKIYRPSWFGRFLEARGPSEIRLFKMFGLQ